MLFELEGVVSILVGARGASPGGGEVRPGGAIVWVVVVGGGR